MFHIFFALGARHANITIVTSVPTVIYFNPLSTFFETKLRRYHSVARVKME